MSHSVDALEDADKLDVAADVALRAVERGDADARAVAEVLYYYAARVEQAADGHPRDRAPLVLDDDLPTHGSYVAPERWRGR